MKEDPCRSGVNSLNKITFMEDSNDHILLRTKRYWYGICREVPVPFPVSEFFQMGKDEGVMDRKSYDLI